MKIMINTKYQLARNFAKVFREKKIKITIKDLYNQLISLKDDFKIERVTTFQLSASMKLSHQLSVDQLRYYFNPVIKITLNVSALRKLLLPRIELSYNSESFLEDNIGCLFKFIILNQSDHHNKIYYAPHIEDYGLFSEICLGDGFPLMINVINKGDIQSAFLIIKSIIDVPYKIIVDC